MYSTIQRFAVGKIFKSLLCSPRLNVFDQKYMENSNIVKYYYNLNEPFFQF